MAIAFYMDHHVPRAITQGLRLQGVGVLTAYEDGGHELDDPALLDRAHELQRVLFTQDDDLLVEASKRQKEEISFSGIIHAHQLRVSIGRCIADLVLIAQVGEVDYLMNSVLFLPLR